MSRSALPENPIRRLITVFFGILLGVYTGLISAPLFAQVEYIPRGQPIPQNVRVVGTNAAGIDLRASAVWMNPVGQTTNHVVPVSIPASRVGQLAKAAIRRGLPGLGWGMLLKDLVNGAGWVIDELTDQVTTTPGDPQQELGTTAYCLQMAPSGEYRCSSSPGQLSAHAHKTANSWTGTAYFYSQPCVVGTLFQGNQLYNCFRPDINQMVSNVSIEQIRTMPNTGWPSNYHNDNIYQPPTPISDADLGNLLKQNPQVVNAILIDPDTGAPIRTPELIEAMNNLRRQLEAANGLDPGPDMDPSDDYTDTVPNQTEFPEFCMWADVVCDFIEWWKDDGPPPEKPEVPWDIENPTDLQQSWSSGLGGGSCPSPHQFTVEFMGWSVSPSFTFEPVCGFATMMRPVVLSMATIIAVLIVAGIRGTKDA